LHVMDQEDARRSRVLYHELRVRYCDLAVLLASIKRNMEELQTRTGSRVRGQSSPVLVIANRTSRFGPGSDYYASVRKELEARLLLLKEIDGFEDIDADSDRLNIHELERRVLLQIESDAG